MVQSLQNLSNQQLLPHQQLVNTQSHIPGSIQQISQNNNYLNSHTTQACEFNPLLSNSGSVYLHSHGTQLINGGVYHVLPTTSMPSSVYVHNVTANVNLHSYPVPSYIHAPSSAFMPLNEIQQSASYINEQNSSVVSNIPTLFVSRNYRRSRGRGNSGCRHSDHNHRQQKQQTSSASIEVLNTQSDSQILSNYVQYGYPTSYLGTSHSNAVYSQIQQAAGNSLYVTPNTVSMIPAVPQIYGYPVIYQPAVISQEHPTVDEKTEERSSESGMSQIWSVPVYEGGYVGQEFVINHNPSALASADASSMLGPSYSMYDTQMHSLESEQINAVQVYDTQLFPVEVEQIQNTTNFVCSKQSSNQVTIIDNNEEKSNQQNEIESINYSKMKKNTKSNFKNFSSDSKNIEQSVDMTIVQQGVRDLQVTTSTSKSKTKKDLNQSVPNFTVEKQVSDDKGFHSSTNEKKKLNDKISSVSYGIEQTEKSTTTVAITAVPSTDKITDLLMPGKNYGSLKLISSSSTPINEDKDDKKEFRCELQSQVHKVKASNKRQVVVDNLTHSKNNEVSFLIHKNEVTANINLNAHKYLSIPVFQSPLSWASLFSKSNVASFSCRAISQTDETPVKFKKPVAKVSPFEGTSNFVSTTPSDLSYLKTSAKGFAANTECNINNAIEKKSIAASYNISKEINNNWFLNFADFLTKYKVDYSSISLKPRGLTNRSNYCYINAILQALIGCPPFYNLMKSIPKQINHSMTEKVNIPTVHAMIQLVSEFSHLPVRARLNKRGRGRKKWDLPVDLACDPSFEPAVVCKLWNKSRSHIEGGQEDAEEFLSYVLNKLNDEMLEVMKLNSNSNSEQSRETNIETDDGDDWQMIYNNKNKGSITRQTDFGRTPLSDIFRGKLRSRLQREGEHSVTDVIQPFFTLQLNIEKAGSVKEALEILVGRDQLEGVTCSRTNQEVAAWQQMTLEELPVVLILHLKWFDYKKDGCTKLFKVIEFPIELKIDTKILASKKYSQKQRMYRLFAVVYHDGKEASKGHYITDVYHTGYFTWLRYDDSSVRPISENNVLRPKTPRVPYLLYYRRGDTIPILNTVNSK